MAFSKGYVKEKMEGFRRFMPLLRELVVRDIKVRYRHSALGLVWTVLNPLLMMVVITIVFSTFFRQNIPNFPIYYLSGSLIFAFNSESTTTALNSIISNASLIKKVYIPKYLPIPIFYTFLFSVGLGILLSAVTVFFRDIAHFYSVFILAWTYFTPIFYPVEILPDAVMKLMRLNPMYHLVTYMRSIVLYGVFPSLKENLLCLCLGLLMLALGLFVFYKKQDKFVLYV